MVVVLAHAEVKEGAVQSFITAAEKCTAPTRKETGCITYFLYSSTENAQELVFIEEWESKEALDTHMNTPHLLSFLEQTKDLLASPMEINIYEANKI